ncbi:hypothetical protein KTE54_27930 [Burkholderia multivorans]|uniref:hypothetical protein n=1 Tax=Burkholderia multivorans TaxID=87883 RepID=UPI001C261A5C|nr:hypothetical protein [Burkholderia multivorans]MBU9564510.1 hypothetical protein [Burkholderia multivorans]
MAMIAAVALFQWTVLWPKLDGHYLDNDQTHMMLSADAAEDSAGQRFDGSRSMTTVCFGRDVLQR